MADLCLKWCAAIQGLEGATDRLLKTQLFQVFEQDNSGKKSYLITSGGPKLKFVSSPKKIPLLSKQKT